MASWKRFTDKQIAALKARKIRYEVWEGGKAQDPLEFVLSGVIP